jgi:hypothetical protein
VTVPRDSIRSALECLRPPGAWRTILPWLAALLVLLSACVPAAAPGAPAGGRAALIIVDAQRAVQQTCVEFEGEATTGHELIRLAGLPMTLDERNAMGALVCAIDGQGCAFPAEDCLCQCRGLGECSYWASFVRTPPGGWTYTTLGLSAQEVRPGDLYAWVWLPSASANADVLGWLPDSPLESICP